MPTSNRSAFLRWSTSNDETSRTAVYGPVRTVVWQGSAGNRRPYADQRGLFRDRNNPRHSGGASGGISRHSGGVSSAFWGRIILYVPVQEPVVGRRLFVGKWKYRKSKAAPPSAGEMGYPTAQAFRRKQSRRRRGADFDGARVYAIPRGDPEWRRFGRRTDSISARGGSDDDESVRHTLAYRFATVDRYGASGMAGGGRVRLGRGLWNHVSGRSAEPHGNCADDPVDAECDRYSDEIPGVGVSGSGQERMRRFRWVCRADGS